MLVLRARDEAEATGVRLVALGHEALMAPLTRVAPTGVATEADGFDAVVATSAQAFLALADPAPLLRLPALTVGDRTAEAARARGFRDVRSAGSDAHGLVALIALTLRPGSRLIYLAGRDRTPDVEDGLARAGHGVATCVVYAAEAIAPWPGASRDNLRRATHALHFSRRGVDLFFDRAREADLAPAAHALTHVCVSDHVAEAVRTAGGTIAQVARRPTLEAVLASV